MVKRPTFRNFLKRQLKDPEFKKVYEAYDPEMELLDQLIEARKKKRMTQQDVAKKLKVPQPSIARFETGGASPSIGRVAQYANAVGKKIVLKTKSAKKNKKKHV